MTAPISDIGTGITIVFGTSAFLAHLAGVEGPGMQRESVKTSHMGTTLNHTFMPGDLVDNGEITMEIHFDPSQTPPIHAAAETVTITWPVPAGLTNPATWAASCFCTGFRPGARLEELMTATVTLKVSGPVTITAAS